MTLLTNLTETEMQELAEQFATFCDDANENIHADLIGDDYADAMMKELGLN